MRAVVMIVADVVNEQTLQMAFVQRNDVIQKLSSAAFDPTLRHAVLPGTLEGGPHRTHPQRSNGAWNLQPVFRIPVENEKPGSRFKRKRLSQLLDDPRTRRTPSDVEVQNAPPIMADDEKAIDHAEGDRWNREEVHRSDGFPVVAQKRKPALGWFGISGCPAHPAGDSSLGEIKTQHQ